MNVELYGTEGAIDTYGERLYRQEADGYHVIQSPDADELTYPHASRMQHFVNVILGREEPCVTLDQCSACRACWTRSIDRPPPAARSCSNRYLRAPQMMRFNNALPSSPASRFLTERSAIAWRVCSVALPR